MIPRWFIWTILAVACWGVWAVASKLLGNALSATHSQALSTLGLFPVMIAIGLSQRPLLVAAGSHWRGALLALGGGVLTCLGNAAYYDLLNRGAKAATVVPLTALYPVVTVVMALVFLKERLNRIQLTGVALSLVAIYLFNVARHSLLGPATLGWVLAPIFLWGAAALLQKVATNHISGELATLWFLAAFIPVAGVILWGEPLPPSISTHTWVTVSGLGLFFAIGNMALLAAFASGGKASIISPIAGLYPLVSVPVAVVFFGERIGVRESAGVVLALVAVVALSMERKLDEPPADMTRSTDGT